jgi:hypothetical protein
VARVKNDRLLPAACWGRCGPAAALGDKLGKKFAAAGLQTRMFAVPHRKEDRAHLQVNKTTKTLPGGPAGGLYLPFCEGLQTSSFAAGLQQIFSDKLTDRPLLPRNVDRSNGPPSLPARPLLSISFSVSIWYQAPASH